MVRFYKTYMGRLLLGLLILIELERKLGKEAVIEAVQGWTGGTDAEQQVVSSSLEYYVHQYPDESPSNDQVLQGAFGQLLKKKSDDADLLDVIVQALRLPFANYFSSNSVKALRDAILNPSELTEVNKTYKSNKRCGCGHEFKQSEMATVTVADGMIMLQCATCARPSYIPCSYCGEQVQLYGKVLTNWMNEVDCGCRKRLNVLNGLAAPDGGITLDGLRPAQRRIILRQQQRNTPPTRAGHNRPAVAPAPANAVQAHADTMALRDLNWVTTQTTADAQLTAAQPAAPPADPTAPPDGGPF